MTVESFTGILIIALFTGIIFARFSRPFARVVFSKVAVVTPFDGVPTLMFRAANQRGNSILDAAVTVSLARNYTTREGVTMRRFQELKLLRSSNPLFALSWTVMHPIDEDSPLYGLGLARNDRAGHGNHRHAVGHGRNHRRPHLCPPCLLPPRRSCGTGALSMWCRWRPAAIAWWTCTSSTTPIGALRFFGKRRDAAEQQRGGERRRGGAIHPSRAQHAFGDFERQADDGRHQIIGIDIGKQAPAMAVSRSARNSSNPAITSGVSTMRKRCVGGRKARKSARLR